MYQPMTIDKLAFNCFRSKENCKNSFENIDGGWRFDETIGLVLFKSICNFNLYKIDKQVTVIVNFSSRSSNLG